MLLSYRGSLYGTVKYSEILKIGVGNIVFKIISCKIVVDNGVYFGYRLIYLTCDHIVICGISFGKRLSMKDLQRGRLCTGNNRVGADFSMLCFSLDLRYLGRSFS